MTSTLESFKHLKRFFPSEFLASISEENIPHRLLVEQRPEATVWRKHIDDCLELAYRYNLVDADLEARLKKGDRESWHAAINELKVAKFLEGILGVGALQWHPQGQEGKIGEFEIVLSNLDKPNFVEVKTVSSRELERMEESVREKLRRYAKQVSFPFVLGISVKEAGKSEDFSGKKFKAFLREELSKINVGGIKEERVKLPDYRDDKTGLQLEVEALPISLKPIQKSCCIGIIGSSEAKLVRNETYIHHSLRKAYAQLPKGSEPCVVILCSLTEFPLNENNMLNALLGTLALRIYHSIDRTAKVPEPESFRKLDGFYHPQRNRHLSATGLFQEKFLGKGIEEKLEIYHNPFTVNLLNDSLFKRKGIRQLVKKNEQQMEWID